MDALSSALAVLTAMITPAVLISASGTLILSTTTRLARVIDRVRSLSADFEELAHGEGQMELKEERRALIFSLLDMLTSRARLLQRCMTVFYTSVGVFVLTSISIGIVAAIGGAQYTYWIPVALGLLGALCLSYGSTLLIFEARLAVRALGQEMDFIWKLGRALAPADLVQQHSPHHNRLTLRRHP
ncbi:MAG: DUF2721 domain-containing protein [Acidobacteria bacterium]|nr:DUF2721 domain-containing protein [Acidobacteriota bacterium]